MSGTIQVIENHHYWLRSVHGLKFLKEGIQDYVQENVEQSFRKLRHETCSSLGIDESDFKSESQTFITPYKAPPKKYSCPFHSQCPCPSNCANKIAEQVAKEIPKLHTQTPAKVQWVNTDPCNWTTLPWEVAKCFLSSAGYKDKDNADDTDCSGLLSIIINLKGIGNGLNITIDGKTDKVSKVENNIKTFIFCIYLYQFVSFF